MSFKDQIKKFNTKAEKAATLIFRGTALSLFGKIITRTPVGNPDDWKRKKAPEGYTGGRLRANWQASINSAASGKINSTDESGSATQSKAKGKMAFAKIGDSIFITNNLPYAQAVENGHSKRQAPAGMVAVTVAEFRRVVAANARKYRR